MIDFYWSRVPGRFVNKNTGQGLNLPKNVVGPLFTGSAREWYETFMETVHDVIIRSDGFKKGDVTVAVNDTVKTILECSVLYKPNFEGKSPVGFMLFSEGKAGVEVRDVGQNKATIFVAGRKVGTVTVLDPNII